MTLHPTNTIHTTSNYDIVLSLLSASQGLSLTPLLTESWISIRRRIKIQTKSYTHQSHFEERERCREWEGGKKENEEGRESRKQSERGWRQSVEKIRRTGIKEKKEVTWSHEFESSYYWVQTQTLICGSLWYETGPMKQLKQATKKKIQKANADLSTYLIITIDKLLKGGLHWFPLAFYGGIFFSWRSFLAQTMSSGCSDYRGCCLGWCALPYNIIWTKISSKLCHMEEFFS